MDDQSRPAEAHDPRIDAALHEYLERVDRGEMLDAQSFVAEHEEIADELRSLIDAEVELRNLAGGSANSDAADASTRSFALQGQETIPPQGQSQPADGSAKGRLKEQFGRYHILKVLGQGAMGTVYLAEDTQLKRQVALKTPHFDTDPSGELLERLYREARAAATLRHPNICPVHDVGEIDGTHYISMAYIEGHPLSAFVRSNKPQPERQTLIVVRKLAQALQDAHDQRIVHRDLKPANIMVDKRGEPLIMDFGLARHTRPDDDVRLTHSGTLVGTPAYMAPEQVDADASKIGPLTDEYSLGVILYELLTSQLPFRGSMMAVLGQIVTKAPRPPSELRPGLDPRIEAACLKMMAKNPSDRFPSLKAVADELASILKNPDARPAPAKPAGLNASAAPDGRAATGAGSSKILKSQALKTLTGSDVESLEELARKCWARHDYDQVIQIAERIPEQKRSAALQGLLEQAREKADEISFLICDIDEAVRLEDGRTALKKAAALLKVKPGHHRALEIQEQFGGWGEGEIVRLGSKRVAEAWREGGWVPWSVVAFGLAVFGVVAGVIIIWMGRSALLIEAKDPGIEVAVKGSQVVITAPGEQSIRLEPGEHEFSVSYAGLETVTKSFKLTKGQTQRLKVEILDGKLRALLQGEILPSNIESEKAKGVGGAAPEAKLPPVVASMAPMPAPKPPTSADGFVSLFNGIDTTGWKPHPSQQGIWRAKNGILIGSAAERSHLYTERGDFKNFHLVVKARINQSGNSGLYFRSTFGPVRPIESPKFPYGYEAQIDSSLDPNRTGSLYAAGKVVVSIAETLVPPGEWFTEEVIAEGNHFVVKVNGRTTAVYRDENEISDSGHIALQVNNGLTVVEFSKIEIKELPASIATASPSAKSTTQAAERQTLIAPFSAPQAQESQQKWSERLKTPVELTNKLKMRLRLIPPGRFQMGANEGPNFVQPAHAVQITRPFYLGTYEVTRAEFGTFIASHPKASSEYRKTGWRLDNNAEKSEKWEPKRRFTWQAPGFAQDANHPAIDVSWDDAQDFCAWLSQTEGRKYRLPTEAEWEYACRAGSGTSRYNSVGDADMVKVGNFADATAQKKFPAWHTISSSDGFVYTAPVGHFRPNNFGLYDTLGNAMEWCWDWYDERYYKHSAIADPPGPSDGKQHVARGGSFETLGDAAGRWPFNHNHRSPSVGFRVVCEIPNAPSVAEPASEMATTGNEANAPSWIGSESRFDETSPGKWRETFPKQPKHASFSFDLVQQTPEFLELIDTSRLKSKGGVSVRLGEDQAQMRWGGPGVPFKLLQRGRWVTPTQAAPDVPPKSGAGSSASRPQGSSFFNGRNLDGWDGLPGFWHVKDHAIVGTVPAGQRAHTFLCSRLEYKDFELKFRARLLGGIGNSGVQFRSKMRNSEKFTVVGPQCEIRGEDGSRTYPTGSLVSEPHGEPHELADADRVLRIFKEADFNDFEIRCVGQHVRIKLNGETTVDADFPSMPDRGLIAWQIHGSRPPREVIFKDIEFTDLSGPQTPGGGL